MKKHIIYMLLLFFVAFFVGYNVYFPNNGKEHVSVKKNLYLEDDEGEEDDSDDEVFEELPEDEDPMEEEIIDDNSNTESGDDNSGGETDPDEKYLEEYEEPEDDDGDEDDSEGTDADEDYDEDDELDSYAEGEEEDEEPESEPEPVSIRTTKKMVCPFDRIYFNNCTTSLSRNKNLSCTGLESGDRGIISTTVMRHCSSEETETTAISMARRIVVLIDDSNSMRVSGSGTGDSKISDVNYFFKKLINGLSSAGNPNGTIQQQAIAKARAKDRLSVCYFNKSSCYGGSKGWSYKKWNSWLASGNHVLTKDICKTTNGTNFQKAYNHAYKQFRRMNSAVSKKKSPMVILMTDGYPTSGYRDHPSLTDSKFGKNKAGFPHCSGPYLVNRAVLTMKSLIKQLKQSSISSTKTARANVRFYSIGIGMKDSDNFAKYVLAPNKAVLGNSGQEGQLKLAVSGKNYQEYVGGVAAFPDYGLIAGSAGDTYISFRIDGLISAYKSLPNSNDNNSSGLGFKFMYDRKYEVSMVKLCNRSHNRWTNCSTVPRKHNNKHYYYKSTGDGKNRVFVLKPRAFSSTSKKYVLFKIKESGSSKTRLGKIKSRRRQGIKVSSEHPVDDYKMGNLDANLVNEIVKKIVEVSNVDYPSGDKDVPIDVKDYQPYCKALGAEAVRVSNICYDYPSGKKKVTIVPYSGVVLRETASNFTMGIPDNKTYSGGYFMWRGADITNDVRWYFTVNKSQGNPLIKISSAGNVNNVVEASTTYYGNTDAFDFDSVSSKLYVYNGGCTNTRYTLSDFSTAVGEKVKDSLKASINAKKTELGNSVRTIASDDPSNKNKKVELVVNASNSNGVFKDSDTNTSSNMKISYGITLQKSWIYCEGNEVCHYKYQSTNPDVRNGKYVEGNNKYYVPYGLNIGDIFDYTLKGNISTILNNNVSSVCKINVPSGKPCLETTDTNCNIVLRFRPIAIEDPFPKNVYGANWFDWWKSATNRTRIFNSYIRNSGVPEYKISTNKIVGINSFNDYDLDYGNVKKDGSSSFVSNNFTISQAKYCARGEWMPECDVR